MLRFDSPWEIDTIREGRIRAAARVPGRTQTSTVTSPVSTMASMSCSAPGRRVSALLSIPLPSKDTAVPVKAGPPALPGLEVEVWARRWHRVVGPIRPRLLVELVAGDEPPSTWGRRAQTTVVDVLSAPSAVVTVTVHS